MLKLRLISLLLLFTLASKVWTYESFNDFPLTLDRGNYLVHATLTDLNLNKKYFLKEYIHSSEYVQGKISISSESSSLADVHYGSSSKNQRLVVQNYDCDLFTYTTRWDKKITSITVPLLNHILLVGPSLIYRLQHKSLVWKTGDDVVIRGTAMHSAYTMFSGTRLIITYYYKETYTLENGILQPSRIQFIGDDPSEPHPSSQQNFILDVYFATRTDENIDKIVSPKPGIGCPIYFAEDNHALIDLYVVVKNSVHYISHVKVTGPVQSTAINEVYADEKNQLLNLKTNKQGITTESIYDYILGLIYTLKSDGGCLVSPMGQNALGVGTNRKLSIGYLLDTHFNYKLLGKTWIEDQSGFKTYTWDSIAYNVTTSSGKYDKMVKTIYTVYSKKGEQDSVMVPVSETIHGYNKNSEGKYSLMETTRKDYYDFGEDITNGIYESKFRIGDCYPNTEDRKTLKIQFNCQSRNCVYAIENHIPAFRAIVKAAIVRTEVISGSRIGNIEIELDSTTIIAYVTFLNIPGLTESFKRSYLTLAKEVFKGVSRSTTTDSIDCLKKSAAMRTSFEAVVFCGTDKSCSQIKKMEDLVEDQQNGLNCMIYEIPLENLNRFNDEIPLDKVSNELKSQEISFGFYDAQHLLHYVIERVDEVNESEEEHRQLYDIEKYSQKIVPDDTKTVLAVSAKSLADCYRACANFDSNVCEFFSYCQGKDRIECLLSTSLNGNLSQAAVYDSDCQLYRKSHLQDFNVVRNRAYINPTSVATENQAYDCANLCFGSDKCFSFQICGGLCTFGGYYTDSTTKYDQDCNIYSPKVAKKFSRTGKKIVTGTYHSELSLTMDQCAALCLDFVSDDGTCISFNYCPKGLQTQSSCSLSKYSVKDSSTGTNSTNDCTNYELISAQIKAANLQKPIEIKGTSGGVAFEIIVLFAAVGLMVGLIGPFLYKKSKSLIPHSKSSDTDETDTFEWKRQEDEKDGQSTV